MRKSLRAALPPDTPWMDVDEKAADKVRQLLGFDVQTAWLRLSALGTLLRDRSIDAGFRDDVPCDEIERLSQSIRNRMTKGKGDQLRKVADVVAKQGLWMHRLLTHWGPERLAAIDWATRLGAVSTALADFLPRAEVRCREHMRLAGWASHAPAYQAMVDNSRALVEAGKRLAEVIAKATNDLEYDRSIALPGLEKGDGRSSLTTLALAEGRLVRAGLTFAEVAKLVPDNHLACPNNERRSLRDHRERIRKRIASVADRLDTEERSRVRGRALARRMAAKGKKLGE